MKCFRCNKEIAINDNYFIMTEMNKQEIVKRDYVHRHCWDAFISKLNGAKDSLAKSNYLLNAMAGHMKNLGIIKDEKVVQV